MSMSLSQETPIVIVAESGFGLRARPLVIACATPPRSRTAFGAFGATRSPRKEVAHV